MKRILYCLVFLILINSVSYGQNKYAASSANGATDYYLIVNTLTKGHSVNGGYSYLQIWISQKPAVGRMEDFRNDQFESFRRIGVNTEGYEGFSEHKGLIQVRCRERKYRYMSFTDYDEAGNVIASTSRKEGEAEWVDVVPESVAEILMNEICRLTNQNKK